jgi:ABC-type nitrate/sulfonate/bicarbonate transport system substrate-binding protein
MIAHEMNFFYDEGLCTPDGFRAYELLRDASVPFGLEKLGISQCMKEKSIDISLDVLTPTVLFQRARGADLYIIAGWRNQQQSIWVSLPEIQSAKGLKGKRIGVSEIGGVTYRGLAAWLRKNGVDPERDVEWTRGIYTGYGDAPSSSRLTQIDALRKGQFDCVAVKARAAEALKGEGFNILVDVKQQYPNGKPDRIIAATGQILESNPDMVKSFLKGMIRAYWFIRDQPQYFYYLYNLEKRLRLESPDPEESRIRFSINSPEDAEALPFPIDGCPTGFETILEEEREAGALDYDVPDVSTVCALDLVKEAFEELLEREEMRAQYERVKKVVERLGY